MVRSLAPYEALTPEGIAYVHDALLEPPARAVGQTSLMSVSGAYASRFPYLVDYESSGAEKPFVLLSIIDPDVIDVISQPKTVRVVAHDVRGRRRIKLYTPDYLCLSKAGFFLVEVKHQADLEKLQAKYPHDWLYDGDSWRHPPGEDVAHRLGMQFKVFCPDRYPKNYLANLQIISRFEQTDRSEVSDSLCTKIRALVSHTPKTIHQLCSMFSGLTARDIYWQMQRGELFGMLEHDLIGPDFVIYGRSEQLTSIKSYLQRSNSSSEQQATGPLHARLLNASSAQLAAARKSEATYQLRRQQGLPMNATDFRKQKLMREAEAEHAPQLAAFVPLTHLRGRRTKLITAELHEEIKKHAIRYLAAGNPPRHAKIFADFCVYAKLNSIYVPSQETHRRSYLASIAPERAAYISGGIRSFHASRPVTDGARVVPRVEVAGLRVHCDGVYSDSIAERDSEAEYARPIFYPFIDDVTGHVLSLGVKIGRPSRLAVAMAHRDCYTKNGFLPTQIYADWGSEFHNKFVPDMQARFGIGYERRPVGAPRHGGNGEMFNAQLSRYLETLAGGMYFDKAGRRADGNKKARATATLSVREIIERVQRWIEDVWEVTPIGRQSQSPSERWEASLKCFPDAVVPVSDDLLARYYTSLPLSPGKFTYKTGFRFAGNKYSSEALCQALRECDTPTDPRLDCMDPSIIYAMTRRGVIELRSSNYAKTYGMSFERRMQEMNSLLSSRAKATRNQRDRNMREALLAAAPEPTPAPPPEAGRNPTNTAPSQPRSVFSNVSAIDLPTLKLTGSSDR